MLKISFSSELFIEIIQYLIIFVIHPMQIQNCSSEGSSVYGGPRSSFARETWWRITKIQEFAMDIYLYLK